MLRAQIRRYGLWLIPIAILMVLGTASGLYVAVQERLHLPWQQAYTIHVELANADAVTPGLGEAANVAGVRVGQISGVTLHQGRATVAVEIDPGKLRHVYTNARAVLIPNTPLKDMQLDLYPGGPPAKPMTASDTLPLGQTAIPIDSDELTAALDADTRTWFQSLVADIDQGTRGRAGDMRALLRALGPTTAQLHELGDTLAARRHEIARVVHNLAVLTRAASSKDRELSQVVLTGNATLQALGSQDVALRQSVELLPGTLATTRRALVHATSFAHALGPTLDDLLPTARRLPATVRDLRTLFQAGALVPLREIPRFAQEAAPLTRLLVPAIGALKAQTPHLASVFRALQYVTNELAYNPGGANQGFLYWLSWFAHNTNSMVSTEDANGAVLRGQATISCSSLTALGQLGPVLDKLVCPATTSGVTVP